jgi:hypothetical protein
MLRGMHTNIIPTPPPEFYSLAKRKETYKNDQKQGNKYVLYDLYK